MDKGFFSDFLTAATILQKSRKSNQLDEDLEEEEGSLDAFFQLLNVVGYHLFKRPTTPPFVVLVEGLDGTGKTTLVNSLAAQTLKIEGQRFNGYAVGTPTASVASVRDIFDKCGGLVSRAFYMVSNYILQHEMRVTSEKDPHAILFVDRWYSSTCAYSIGWKNTSGGPESVDALHTSLLEWPKDLDVPDLMIVLHVDSQVRRERISRRGKLLNHNPWDDRLNKDENLGRRIVRVWERKSGPRKSFHLSANQSKEDVLRESYKVITERMFRQLLPMQYFRHNPLGLFRWVSSSLGYCSEENGQRYERKIWNYQVCVNDTDNRNVFLENHEIEAVDDDCILSFSVDHMEDWLHPRRNALASAIWVQGEYPNEYRWRADGILRKVTEAECVEMGITPSPVLSASNYGCICERSKRKEKTQSLLFEGTSTSELEVETGYYLTKFVPLRMRLRTGSLFSRDSTQSYDWVRDESGWSIPIQTTSLQSSCGVLHGKTVLPVTVAILGTHTSGKKTVGERLAAIFGWSFHPKLGDILRDKDKIVAGGHRTGDGTAEKLALTTPWDDVVHSAECERDRTTTSSRVVETWHVGNMAWSLLRQKSSTESQQNAGQVIERAKAAIRSELEKAVVLFVHLRIEVETCIRRRRIEENSKRIPMIDESHECAELHEALDVQGAELLSEFADLSIPVLQVQNSEDGDQAMHESLRQIVHFVNRNLWRKVL
ncbi:Thymidylate kinase [Gracilaria domingensis]|nr:Thymidylate kinase [Gracilaria domingensis]